jgi:hypothetical protein
MSGSIPGMHKNLQKKTIIFIYIYSEIIKEYFGIVNIGVIISI